MSDRPLTPRTAFFREQQGEEWHSLDIILLNISDDRTQKRLKDEFMRHGMDLDREEFVTVMVDVLPDQLSGQDSEGLFRSPQEMRGVIYNLFDRLDTDGDGRVDWREMTAFVLQQSAVMSEQEQANGGVLPYIEATGASARHSGAREDGENGSDEEDETAVSVADTANRLQEVFLHTGADHGGRLDHRDFARLLRDKSKREMQRVQSSFEGAAGSHRHSGGGGGGGYRTISLLKYIPSIDCLARVEAKKEGLDLLSFKLPSAMESRLRESANRAGIDGAEKPTVDPLTVAAATELETVATLSGQGGAVEAIEPFTVYNWSSTGRPFLLTAAANSTIAVWDLAPGPRQFGLVSSWPTPVAQQSLLYSGRYRLLYSGSVGSGTIYTWNIRTGQVLTTMSGHSDITFAMAEVSSQDRLVSGSHDGTLRVWDQTTGVNDLVLTGHKRGIVDLALWEPRSLLISASYDHMAYVWSPQLNKPIIKMQGHSAPLIGVRAAPETPEVVTAGRDGHVCVWDLRRPREPVYKLTIRDEGMVGASVGTSSNRSSSSRSSSSGNELRAFELCIRPPPGAPSPSPSNPATHATDPFLATAAATAGAKPAPAAGAAGGGDGGVGGAGGSNSGVAGSSGSVGASAGSGGEAERPVEGTGEKQLPNPRDAAKQGTSGGNSTKGGAKTAKDIVGGIEAALASHGPGSSSTGGAAEAPAAGSSKAGNGVQQLICATHYVHLFTQQQTPELLRRTDRDAIVAVAFSPLQCTVLTASGTTVKVWSALVGSLLRIFSDIAPSQITCLLMEPRGVTFAVGCEDGSVRVHNASSGHARRVLHSHAGEVTSLAWFGSRLVSVGWDRKIFLHSAKDSPGTNPDRYMILGQQATQHAADITSVVASEAHGVVVSGDTDGVLLVYHVQSGRLEAKRELQGAVTALHFLAEEDVFVSADATGTMLLWSVRAAGSVMLLLAGFRHKPMSWWDAKGNVSTAIGKLRNRRLQAAKRRAEEATKEKEARRKARKEKMDKELERLGLRQPAKTQVGEEPSEASTTGGHGKDDGSEGEEGGGDGQTERSSLKRSTGRVSAREGRAAGGAGQTHRDSLGRSRLSFQTTSRVLQEPSDESALTGASASTTTAMARSSADAPPSLASDPSVADVPAEFKHVAVPFVTAMVYDPKEAALFTADDQGRVTSWKLRPLLTSLEVHVLRVTEAFGGRVDRVKRRHSLHMDDSELHNVATARAENILTSVTSSRSYDPARQPALPAGIPTPSVSAPLLLEVNWTTVRHDGAVIDLQYISHPHIHGTVLSGGIDCCAVATDADNGMEAGLLCLRRNAQGRNPRWDVQVDVDGFREALQKAETEATEQADAVIRAQSAGGSRRGARKLDGSARSGSQDEHGKDAEGDDDDEDGEWEEGSREYSARSIPPAPFPKDARPSRAVRSRDAGRRNRVASALLHMQEEPEANRATQELAKEWLAARPGRPKPRRRNRPG